MLIATESQPIDTPKEIVKSLDSVATETVLILATATLTWLINWVKIRQPYKPRSVAVNRLLSKSHQLDLILTYLLGIANGERIELLIAHNGSLSSGAVSYDKVTTTNVIVNDSFDNLVERLVTERIKDTWIDGSKHNEWIKVYNRYAYIISNDSTNVLGVIKIVPSENTDIEYTRELSRPVIQSLRSLINSVQPENLGVN